MNTISLGLPLLYILLVLGLCTFLLVRGITHLFVGLFAAGALLELIPQAGFLALREAPGGFAANSHYIPFLTIFGLLGMLCFAAGFITLTMFLLASSTTRTNADQ